MLNTLLICASLLFGQATPSTTPVSFVKDIAPIIVKRCSGCHGEKTNQGGYRADTFRNIFKLGVSGLATIEHGFPEKSNLYRLISSKVESIRMPKSDSPLTASQINKFRQWIQEGAKFDSSNPNALLRSLSGPREHPVAPLVYRKSLPVTALNYLPGKHEIAVSGYNEVTFWNVLTGSLVRRIGGLPQWIRSIHFTHDGTKMIVAGGSPGEYGEVCIVDTQTGKRLAVLGVMSDTAFSLALSADDRYAVAGFADATVQCYDLLSLQTIWSTRVQSDWITGLAFSKDGKYIASGSRDTTVKVLEAKTGELFATYSGHNRQIGKYRGQFPVFTVMFDPSGNDAFSAGAGEWIQRWNPEKVQAEAGDAGDMEERFAKAGHAKYLEHGLLDAIYGMQIRNGMLFTCSLQGAVSVIDLAGVKPFQILVPVVESCFIFTMPQDGKQFATGSFSGNVRIYDSETGKLKTQFPARPGQSSTVKSTRR